MRSIRRAALGATLLALVVGACTSGGGSPTPAASAPTTSATLASALVLGGPPECPQRPFCAVGLEKTYGLTFKEFKPLDAGGPITVEAVKNGQVDVGLLFTSDPAIAANGFVLLADDKQLQLADNLVPVLRQAVLDATPAIADLLDGWMAKLTQEALTDLNKQVSVDQKDPKDVVKAWLGANGLTAGYRRRGHDHQGRLHQLLRAGDPRRAVRPGPRGGRLQDRPQVPARQPRDRLPGPRGRRDRHPRGVRRDRPRVRQQRGRRGVHRSRCHRGQAEGAAGAEGPHRPRPGARDRPERLRRHEGDRRHVRHLQAERPGEAGAVGRPSRHRAPPAPCRHRRRHRAPARNSDARGRPTFVGVSVCGRCRVAIAYPAAGASGSRPARAPAGRQRASARAPAGRPRVAR